MGRTINKFEDILAWQTGQKLSSNIYKVFKKNRDYFFKDQICRASVSVSNNIAEGFERRTKKEFIMFLYIAKGSCGEVRSMLYLADKLNYINKKHFDILIQQTVEASKLINGFIKYLKNNNF